MKKFALVDEMCRRSEAGTVMFKKAYGSFQEEIQEMATKCVDRCNDVPKLGPCLIDEKCIGNQILLLKQKAAWSHQQERDTRVLDFIQDSVVVVIVCTERILKRSHSARVQIHPLFNRAASAVQDKQIRVR